jgi:hypothetical protein
MPPPVRRRRRSGVTCSSCRIAATNQCHTGGQLQVGQRCTAYGSTCQATTVPDFGLQREISTELSPGSRALGTAERCGYPLIFRGKLDRSRSAVGRNILD